MTGLCGFAETVMVGRFAEEESAVKYCNKSHKRHFLAGSERGLVGVRSRRLLLQKSDALFEHPHLRLVSLHHRHHLRLQLLQLVLVLLLGFLIRRHQITAAQHTQTQHRFRKSQQMLNETALILA